MSGYINYGYFTHEVVLFLEDFDEVRGRISENAVTDIYRAWIHGDIRMHLDEVLVDGRIISVLVKMENVKRIAFWRLNDDEQVDEHLDQN